MQPNLNENMLERALDIFMPSWPLQNTVAVNPFWNMKHKNFKDVMRDLEPIFHESLLMPLEYYLNKFKSQGISVEALNQSLVQNRPIWPNLPASSSDLIKVTSLDRNATSDIRTIAEVTPGGINFHRLVIDEIGKYAAAYFDHNQALIKFPWQQHSFWEAWHKSQIYDATLKHAGIVDFCKNAINFQKMGPEEAIETMLLEMNIKSTSGKYLYLQRACATLVGWGSQFRYIEWQKNLGYNVSGIAKTVELLAVRVLYDFLIFKQTYVENKDIYMRWSTLIDACDLSSEVNLNDISLKYTWHLALELTYQRDIAVHLSKAQKKKYSRPESQLIFCIDVRSEMIRRHIESFAENCETIGFAGFFAVALESKKIDEVPETQRLPVLLKPAITVQEHTDDTSQEILQKRVSLTLLNSYFRLLRKNSISSFIFVELFGILSIASIGWRTIKSVYKRFRHIDLPERFTPMLQELDFDRPVDYSSNEIINVQQKTSIALNALQHMGLRDNFAKLILVVGHGAVTTNNAFGSALDCGACGGHAGDINARFIVSLLNSPQIRLLLAEKNIKIPDSSCFIAAVHETVTDEIYILDRNLVPKSCTEELTKLTSQLKVASQHCRQERQITHSLCLDSSARKRSINWSEVRPEWGLSGNACFIVAPRERTKGVNLASRSFLHNYDWKKDEEFRTLELIMTAPMIVTNWINMQYFASVVSPRYYGSGNKVLHNLTNENAVVEGNGGDLRVGLSVQSIHDGEKVVHDPLRLSVFIEAPRLEIEKIIAKHQMLTDLVVNEWLHIFQIDSSENRCWKRFQDGTYTDFLSN